MRHAWRGTTVALVALLAVSCGGDSDDGAPPTRITTPEPTESTPTGSDDGPTGAPTDDAGSTDDAQAIAVADAAQRAGVDATDVSVVVNEEVTWPDGAIGCPQPDQFYTQALVPGYRIIVEVDGDQLHYHGRRGQAPTYCADPSPPAEGSGVVDR